MACAGLPLLVGVNQHGGRPRDEEAHIGAEFGREPWVLQKAGVKCGHAHETRRRGKGGYDLFGREALHEV